uniref:Uncharacterized protein n=1 Tax=Accipiter nisus TaxID=211598 RepID=A0A8B9M5P5_9AVES
MMVASTKSLWETGEVAAQSATKSLPCKDIVAGDIVSKRSLWEQKGNPKPEANIKVIPTLAHGSGVLCLPVHLWECLLKCSKWLLLELSRLGEEDQSILSVPQSVLLRVCGK